MSNFFCECKDSGEPPCFGLVQLRADLAAREEELARVKAEYANSIAAWTGIEDERKAAEQRAEAAERERDAAGIELQRHKAGFPGGWTEELQRQIEFRHNAERDRDEWKRKAEEAARDAVLGQILMRYIDRLTDPYEGDPTMEIVEKMNREVIAAIAAKGEK